MNRIYTKPSIIHRIRRSPIAGVILFFALLVAAGAAAEAMCAAVGSGYDPRIEVPA
jgi:hypothetical protein